MKICEGCVNQGICKFKPEVEKYENKTELPEPLDSAVTCKYKGITQIWRYRFYNV